MSQKLDYEKLRHAGKPKLYISSETMPKLREPTKEEKALWRAQNKEKHRISNEHRKGVKEKMKAIRKQEEEARQERARRIKQQQGELIK